MTASTSESVSSYAEIDPYDPYDFYARMRDMGDVVWDEGLQAWLITTARACDIALREDYERFRHIHARATERQLLVEHGGRGGGTVARDTHTKIHRWMMRAISPSRVEPWRESIVQPVIDAAFGQFAGRGRAELVSELAFRVPIRVILALHGLPWQDEEWVTRYESLMLARREYVNRTLQGLLPDTEGRMDAAIEAHAQAIAMLRPFVIEARTSADTLTAQYWDADLLESWSEEDVLARVYTVVAGGSESTARAISNAIYLLLTHDELREQLAASPDSEIKAFVEEVLRLNGPVQFRPRVALCDSELYGAQIKAGDVVLILNSAANRDEAKRHNALEVDLSRESPRDHVAFGFGPRMCVGAALARAELQQTVKTLLSTLPDVRLEPNAAPPQFCGYVLSSYMPLHAVFSPVEPKS